MQQDDLGFIRFDARAGFTRCTEGKTVPCGRVCRKPQNCAKGKSTKERAARIGEANLKEFAEARRLQLEKKRKPKAQTSAGKIVQGRRVKQEEPDLRDPFLDPWLEKDELTDSDFKQMVRDRLKVLPTEADFDRWTRIEIDKHVPGKTRKEKAESIKSELYSFLEQRTSKEDIAREEEKLKKARTENSKEKIRQKIESMKQGRRLALEEAEEFYGKGVDSESVLFDYMGDRTAEFRTEINDLLTGDNSDRTRAAYAMIAAGIGVSKTDFDFAWDVDGGKSSKYMVQEAFNKRPGRSLLGIEGAPQSASELRKAYRSAAMMHHPDRGGDPAKFRRLTDEYEGLKQKYGFDSLADRIDSLLSIIRFDRRCTPGVTVPCGRTCRQPKNCAKARKKDLNKYTKTGDRAYQQRQLLKRWTSL